MSAGGGMSDDTAHNPLTVLVVDDQPVQRRLVGETLRAAGRVRVNYGERVSQVIASLIYFLPDMMVVDWDVDGGKGLDLVLRIRAGEAGEEFKALPIIMVTARKRQSDIERARSAGGDEFVVRPFSTATMVARVMEVRARPREFVETATYSGPCRRRRRDADYNGPRRRLMDAVEDNADAPDVQIRKGLARMYVEKIAEQLKVLEPGAPARELCLTCGQLNALADDMQDPLLVAATASLFSYVKGVGAEATINNAVVQAHLDAILQLAELPNFEIELRRTVTQELSALVAKKLRKAGAAA